MKALLVIGVLFIGVALMGGSFYYVLDKNGSYQAETAQVMKSKFIETLEPRDVPIEIQTTSGELWLFPKDPNSWTFTINGTVLQVKPSTPSIMQGENMHEFPSIDQAPNWGEVKTTLHALVFDKLRLNPKPSAQNELEILAP